MDCYCDYDPPEFYAAKIRLAKKQHKCGECAGYIKLGERYEHVVGKWDGYFDTFKTCERCIDLQTWVKNNVPCFCPVHGNMDTSMREAIDGAYDRAPDEVRGLWFGFLRRIVLRARHNKV